LAIYSFLDSSSTTSTSWTTTGSTQYSDISTILFGKDETKIYIGGQGIISSVTQPYVSRLTSSNGYVDLTLTTNNYINSTNAFNNLFVNKMFYLNDTVTP
jgi:hypothetical protein